jgi:hypothetical protein
MSVRMTTASRLPGGWTRAFFLFVSLLAACRHCEAASQSSLSPSTGSALGGYQITVSGSGFDTSSTAFTCRIACGGNTLSAAAATTSDTSLSCQIGRWTWGACQASLTVYDGASPVSGSALTFTWTASWTTLSQALHPSTPLPPSPLSFPLSPLSSRTTTAPRNLFWSHWLVS